MEQKTQHPHEEYAGPTKLETALGKGKKWGIIGGLTGNVLGAIGGMFLIKPEGEFAQYAGDKLPGFIKKRVDGKGLAVIGLSALTGLLFHKIAMWSVVARNWGEAGKGREQFEQMRDERDAALNRAEVAEAALQEISVKAGAPAASHASQHSARSEHGSHAAAHAAEKDAAPEMAR